LRPKNTLLRPFGARFGARKHLVRTCLAPVLASKTHRGNTILHADYHTESPTRAAARVAVDRRPRETIRITHSRRGQGMRVEKHVEKAVSSFDKFT
jgi:hypothetical protein